MRTLLQGIAPIVTRYDPQGIDLHFLNHPIAYHGIQTAQDVQVPSTPLNHPTTV